MAAKWTVERKETNPSSNGKTRGQTIIRDERGNAVARMVRQGNETDARAALLAAAPELLAACELAAAYIGMFTGDGVPARYVGRFESYLNESRPNAALSVVLDAIAKAERSFPYGQRDEDDGSDDCMTTTPTADRGERGC